MTLQFVFTACPPNFYTVFRGSEACTPCPRNSVTQPGTLGVSIKSCVCAKGYMGIPGEACIGKSRFLLFTEKHV